MVNLWVKLSREVTECLWKATLEEASNFSKTHQVHPEGQVDGSVLSVCVIKVSGSIDTTQQGLETPCIAYKFVLFV